MNIIQSFITNNDCYVCGDELVPEGIMLHSVGCAQPRASVFVKNFNRPDYAVAVHGFIDGLSGDTTQTLPWTMRGWHCGGAGNDKYISIEMCEPSTIKYVGGASWVELSDGRETKEVVFRTYNSAVELFAKLCKEFNFDPLQDGVIISHYEGYKRGIASGHSDPDHIWKKFGLSMDTFRNDVYNKMNNKPISTDVKETASSKSVLYKVQVGAYSNRTNANSMVSKLKSAGFSAFIVKSGKYYKVQTGSFSVKANATTLMSKLKNKGFDAVIVTVNNTTSTSTTSGSTTSFTFTYKYDSWVKSLQEVLESKGNNITVDGIAGQNTLNVAKKYSIRQNDSGPLTKCVQERLNQLGYNCGTADGIAGTNTMNAIARFQSANKLGVGYLGGNDWYYLMK